MSKLLRAMGKGPLLESYYAQAIHGGLAKLRAIRQHGVRQGEDLFTHFYRGALMIYALHKTLGLDEQECRLLMAAFSIHDLNKLPGADSRSFPQLLEDRELITGALNEYGVASFFPEWEDYLPDIKILISHHSGHMHHGGEMLIPALDQTQLGLERLERLIHLMKAADLINLSRSFAEKKHKAEMLTRINAVGGPQMRWLSHRLAEHRGLLGNLLHNSTAKALQEKMQALPLLFYPEGNWYLIPKEVDTPDWKDLVAAVSGQLARSLQQIRSQDLSQLVELSKDGIKIDAVAFSLGVAGEKLLQEVRRQIYRRKFKIDDQRQKMAGRFAKKNEGEDIDSYLQEHQLSFPLDDEGMRKGEYIRATYNLLKRSLATEEQFTLIEEGAKAPWEVLYRLFELDGAALDRLDLLYDRPFVVGGTLSLPEDELHQRLLPLWEQVVALVAGENAQDSAPQLQEPLAEYITETLRVEGIRPSLDGIGEYWQTYTTQNHKQCCHSASRQKTDKWMAPEVPQGMTVQQFSNRLEGGSRSDPKRHICPICKEQFSLERLFFPVINHKAIYLHFMPVRPMTADELEGIRQGILRLAEEDSRLLRIDGRNMEYDSLLKQEGLPVIPNRGQGIAVPHFSEAIGNIISLPFYPGGDETADGSRFWRAVEMGMRLGGLFGCKCLISEDAIPPLPAENFATLYIDGAPAVLEAFFGGTDLDDERRDALLERFDALHRIEARIRPDPQQPESEFYHLARSLTQRPFDLFFAADRCLERRARHSANAAATANYTGREIAPDLMILFERSPHMNAETKKASDYLKEMAALAWSNQIKGSSLERNSLLHPFNELFNTLRRTRGYLDLDALEAEVTGKITDHLERLSKAKGFGLKRERRDNIQSFVELGFALLREVYGGRVSAILPDERGLKAAYLTFLRAQIPRKKTQEEEGEDAPQQNEETQEETEEKKENEQLGLGV